MKKTVRDVPLSDKRVLVRVDFNVPLEGSRITDDTRIRAALPTIRYLVQQRARAILCSHLGRPKGVTPGLSLAPCAARLGELLEQPVAMAPDCIGPEAGALAAALQPGQVLLLENLRFHPEEEKNDPAFAQQLAGLAAVYVNDAFGTAHRAHASTEGVARYLPAVAGFLMEKEISVIGAALAAPERPFVAIIGGAKVSDKIGVIENLLSKVDCLVIGGGMANTFLKARGFDMGKSLVEAERVELAAELIRRAAAAGVELLLPDDLVVAAEFKADAPARTVAADAVPADWLALDIGPATSARYSQRVAAAGTALWNGPMGVFEFPTFAAGTLALARAMSDCRGVSIVGGGDSVAAVEQMGLAEKMTHVSTGGGASLEFLEGKTLPGVACLQDK